MRNKRRFAFFLVFLVIVAALFTWPLWYPRVAGLFGFSPSFSKYFNWIEQHNTTLALLVSLLAVILQIIDLLIKPSHSEKPTIFKKISSQELHDNCRFSDVRWVDRRLMNRDTLEINRRIVITGVSGAGKTREMVEQAGLAEGKSFPREHFLVEQRSTENVDKL